MCTLTMACKLCTDAGMVGKMVSSPSCASCAARAFKTVLGTQPENGKTLVPTIEQTKQVAKFQPVELTIDHLMHLETLCQATQAAHQVMDCLDHQGTAQVFDQV